MSLFIDITGNQYGKLKVIQLHCGGYGSTPTWECMCDCGNQCIVVGHKLKSGHTKSCGCLKNNRGFENIVGQKFNLLTVVSFHSNSKGKVRWHCICDCGEVNIVLTSNLKNGSVKSCGCLGKDNFKSRTKHGMRHTRLYYIWDNMKSRCYRKNHHSYKYYGEKGIKICDEWLCDFKNFYNWAMLNGYTDSLTIERDKVDKGYNPENCRWIPQEEQGRNTSVSLGVEKVIEIKKLLQSGKKEIELSELYGVHPSTIHYIKTGKNYSYVTLPKKVV